MTPDNRAITGPYEAIPYVSEQGIYFRLNRELNGDIRELLGVIREFRVLWGLHPLFSRTAALAFVNIRAGAPRHMAELTALLCSSAGGWRSATTGKALRSVPFA